MNSFQLLAIDLDGTLFGHELSVPNRTREALSAWLESGRRLVIATGRMYHSARRVADDLGISEPIICYQGALIRCPRTEQDLWHQGLQPGVAGPLIANLEAQGFTILAFRNERVHAREHNADTRAYTKLSRTEAVLVSGWDGFFAQGEVTKVVAVSSPDRVSAVAGPLRSNHKGVAHVVQSQPNFLEIVHPDANKGAALAKVCHLLDVGVSSCVAVGDGQNDIEMVQLAGLGVAMGQGHPELKAVADRITQPLAEEGLAAVIEDLLSLNAPAEV